MSSIPEYLHILPEHLKEKQIFPFHIFIFSPTSNTYTLFLPHMTPLDDEKASLVDYIVEKNGELAILTSQRNTFFAAQNLTPDDLPALRMTSEHPLMKEAEAALDLLNSEIEFDTRAVFQEALETNSFEKLLDRMKKEVAAFFPDISPTISLARHLTKELNLDEPIVKEVVFAYFLAKSARFSGEQLLSELICATLFHRLGEMLLCKHRHLVPEEKIRTADKNEWKKHGGLSVHLLKKLGTQMSEHVYEIILAHHERDDGRGFPNELKGEYITPLALVLGATSYLFDFSSGNIDGVPKNLKATIRMVLSKEQVLGNQYNFGERVEEGLQYLLSLPINSDIINDKETKE